MGPQPATQGANFGARFGGGWHQLATKNYLRTGGDISAWTWSMATPDGGHFCQTSVLKEIDKRHGFGRWEATLWHVSKYGCISIHEFYFEYFAESSAAEVFRDIKFGFDTDTQFRDDRSAQHIAIVDRKITFNANSNFTALIVEAPHNCCQGNAR